MSLARALRAFFAEHLPRVRGTSPHTIQSYRDSLVLLLRFVSTQTQRSVIQLDLDDLGPQPILAFLQYLELDRRNSVATRNVRLAAIHAFFRYCALEYPARLAHCQRVLAVPFKRTGSRLVEYLEHEEIRGEPETPNAEEETGGLLRSEDDESERHPKRSRHPPPRPLGDRSHLRKLQRQEHQEHATEQPVQVISRTVGHFLFPSGNATEPGSRSEISRTTRATRTRTA